MPKTQSKPGQLSPEAEEALEQNTSLIRYAIQKAFGLTSEQADEIIAATYAVVAIKFHNEVPS